MSRVARLPIFLLTVAAALIFSAAAALAGPFDEHGPAPEPGLRLPDGQMARPNHDLGAGPAARGSRAWARFAAENDGGPGPWLALWNRDTGVPARVYGDYVEVPGAVADPQVALQAARQILFGHLDLFAPGTEPANFVLRSNHLSTDGAYRSVGFEQVHRGMPVVGGQLSVRFKNDRAFVLASGALPGIDVEKPSTRVPDEALRRRSEDWIRRERGGLPRARSEVTGPMVLPILGEVGLRFAVVVKVVVDLDDPVERWDVYLDPATGDEVAREQTLMFADGTISFDVVDRYPLNGRTRVPASPLELEVTTAGATTRETVGSGGILSWPGSESATLANPPQSSVSFRRIDNGATVSTRSGFSGPHARLVDAAQTGPTALSGDLVPGGTLTLGDARDESTDANFNTFQALHVARDRVLELDPGNGWLTNTQLLAVTNRDDGACNGFADGSSINLFGSAVFQGGSCENTGRIDDVVFHEFGHNVHSQNLIPGVGSFAIDHSEGLSDYIAATLTGDPAMARGFFGTNAPLRQIDPPNPNTWSLVGESPSQHTRGLAYAGAQWDLREALIAKLGPEAGVDEADRLWFETLRRASGMLTTFVETVAANDDDGNIGNGSPDYCEILSAFATHELAVGEGFAFSVDGVDVSGLDITVRTTPPAVACSDLPSQRADAVRVRWSVDGENPSEQVLELQASGDDWTGSIPADALEPGSLVRFAIEVVRGDGTTIDLPRNPASPRYELFYGEVDELFCTDFETDPFGDLGFTSELLFGDPDQPGNNDWQWGTPEAPDVDAPEAFDGTSVVGNDLGGTRNGVPFNGRYRRGVVNRLVLPSVEASGYEQVRLHYRRWLSVVDRAWPQFGGRRFDQALIASNDVVVWESGVGERTSDHVDEEWRFHSVDLSDALRGGTVDVAFELSADSVRGLGTRGGWTLDDLCVVGFNPPVCGNGEVELGETCDDGNTADFDGCQADCTPSPEPVCGNDIVERGEACDDGNTIDFDGCQADCTLSPDPVCGNDIVERGEACDDGNTIDFDGCQADCTISPEPVCGNGVVEAGEVCDDGNADDTDDCTQQCTIPAPPEDPEEPEDPGSNGGLAAADDGCVCVTGQPLEPATSLSLVGALGALLWGRRRRAGA